MAYVRNGCAKLPIAKVSVTSKPLLHVANCSSHELLYVHCLACDLYMSLLSMVEPSPVALLYVQIHACPVLSFCSRLRPTEFAAGLRLLSSSFGTVQHFLVTILNALIHA